jgi:protoporphyrinogen oxidase
MPLKQHGAATNRDVLILGGGMTGLAAGLASGGLVLERRQQPGGICASYSLRPGSTRRCYGRCDDEETYRFEIGGGHWLWGADPVVMRLLRSFTPFRAYERNASVFLPDRGLSTPYPIQDHLHCLGGDEAARCVTELLQRGSGARPRTMQEWIVSQCGPTLAELFFSPFHELYTAGLWTEIAPQDAAKSPIDPAKVVRGALGSVSASGYNTTFMYPEGGFGPVVSGLAERCAIEYGAEVAAIDTTAKEVQLSDGSRVPYRTLISTLPLVKMAGLCSISIGPEPDPFTSVLVLNLGAEKGPRCPEAHWVYVPSSQPGFHRVGFYSNVDASFLPRGRREANTHAALYVEKAYRGGAHPSEEEKNRFCADVIAQLRAWEWIGHVELSDLTYVEVAYTWSRPNSTWRETLMKELARRDIYQVGRYGRWASAVTDQGLAHSVRDGLMAGGSLR